MTRFFGERRSFREGLEAWPFALAAALAMTFPYLVVAATLGPEFPSLIGGLTGLALTVPLARRGWGLPQRSVPWDFASPERWPDAWKVVARNVTESRLQPERKTVDRSLTASEKREPLSTLQAWAPYLLVAALLVITRVRQLPIRDVLSRTSLTWDAILGTNIGHTATPLALPGTVFLAVSLLTCGLHRMPRRAYAVAWRRSLASTAAASAALISSVPLVQLFIYSGSEAGPYPSMPQTLAAGVEAFAGGAWPLLSPLVGGLGAAIAGSNTISNMMFSLFQFEAALRIGADPLWIVALQAVGGAAGNTICVHNVVAASAVVGMVGREGAVLRKTAAVFAYYILVAGVLGLLIAGLASADS